ncbi:MAG TPA: MDR family MFS transporter [Ramlibacter sp.]|nr:MDR family MFS transporter [Ramlibacter sp.]
MSSPLARSRVVPLVIALPIFLQNLDALVLATALPAIAASLQVPVLDVNLAITGYLLSLAVFLPASAWLEQRLGARRLFCVAVLLFTAGSALCAMAQTLEQLVGFRLLQGAGGAMMVPVGRTILLRTIPPSDMVRAMMWFTIPGAVGRLAGPLFGGLLVTLASWRWIFVISIPFSLAGVGLLLWLVDRDPPRGGPARRFDLVGLLLLTGALVGLLGGLQLLGKPVLPPAGVAALVLAGALALGAYFVHCRRVPQPILDLDVLRYPIYRTTVVGGFPIRIALGASPFLLPLMFQVGFGFSALEAGVLTMAIALGALSTRAAVARTIRTFGFRTVLVSSSLLSAVFFVGYGLFRPGTPQPVMFATLMVGGLLTSLTMVTLSTLGYCDVPPDRAGHATALVSMTQQLSNAVGVVLGATVVSIAAWLHRGDPDRLQAADFPPAFLAIALLAAASAFAFRRLEREAGAEMR